MRCTNAGVRVLFAPMGQELDAGPIIFLPALGFTGHSFAAVVARMSAGRRRVLVDLPGIGEEPATSTSEAADIIDAVARVLGDFDRDGQRPILVGHSIGGAIAVRLLAERRLRVEALILVDAAVAPFPFAWWEHLAAHPALWAPMLRLFGAPRVVRLALPRVLHEPPLADAWDVEELARQLADPVRRRTMVAYYKAFLLPKELAATERGLGQVHAPVLILRGARDTVLPNSLLAEAVAALPERTRAEVHVFPYGGHLLPLEAPSAVADAIDGFIEELPLLRGAPAPAPGP